MRTLTPTTTPMVIWPASLDRKSTRLNSSHLGISYAVFCLKKKKNKTKPPRDEEARTKEQRTTPPLRNGTHRKDQRTHEHEPPRLPHALHTTRDCRTRTSVD